jgi:sugar/nucleoside kinase (ribokinase family)
MQCFDLVLIGSYTKDTVVSPAGARQVDGGGFNYGAHVAAMMGMRTAAVTRLSSEDIRVVRALERIGVAVFPAFTPHSTTLRLTYPGDDPDCRTLSVSETAGAFTPGQVRDLEARAFLLNPCIRGEIPAEVVRVLRGKRALLAADVQGFVRALAPGGTLACAEWPEKEEMISCFDVLKADIVEAEALTGTCDLKNAARAIAKWGPGEVVLTHRDGVLVFADDRFFEAPFRPRLLAGRSGRGDTCIAAYVARRLSGSPQDATVWTAAVTSLKLEAEGPIRRTVTDVEDLIAREYVIPNQE